MENDIYKLISSLQDVVEMDKILIEKILRLSTYLRERFTVTEISTITFMLSMDMDRNKKRLKQLEDEIEGIYADGLGRLFL